MTSSCKGANNEIDPFWYLFLCHVVGTSRSDISRLNRCKNHLEHCHRKDASCTPRSETLFGLVRLRTNGSHIQHENLGLKMWVGWMGSHLSALYQKDRSKQLSILHIGSSKIDGGGEMRLCWGIRAVNRNRTATRLCRSIIRRWHCCWGL